MATVAGLVFELLLRASHTLVAGSAGWSFADRVEVSVAVGGSDFARQRDSPGQPRLSSWPTEYRPLGSNNLFSGLQGSHGS